MQDHAFARLARVHAAMGSAPPRTLHQACHVQLGLSPTSSPAEAMVAPQVLVEMLHAQAPISLPVLGRVAGAGRYGDILLIFIQRPGARMERLNDFDPSDVVTDVLRGVRVRGTIFCRSILRVPWGFSVRPRQAAAFHFVASGECQLEVDGVAGAIHLAPRDLAVLANGNQHTIRDGPGSPARWLDELLAEHPLNGNGDFEGGGDGAPTTLICGGFFVDGLHANSLLASLPAVLHITAAQGRAVPWLAATLDWIESEVAARSPGSEAVTTRLAEILFIEAMRVYCARSDASRSGWLRALADPQIGAALALIHRQPEAGWSLDLLATRLNMSRSSFSAKFNQLVGEPPLHYLTRCRLDKAAGLLRMTKAKVADVAQMVGYESEAAFSRAFKRIFQVGPGEFRRGAEHMRELRGSNGAEAQMTIDGLRPSPDDRRTADEPS